MKTATIRNNHVRTAVPRYPNAADRSYYVQKFLDGLLMVATCVGGFVALTFLLLM